MDFVIAVAWSRVLDSRYILTLQSGTGHRARSVECGQAGCAREDVSRSVLAGVEGIKDERVE